MYGHSRKQGDIDLENDLIFWICYIWASKISFNCSVIIHQLYSVFIIIKINTHGKVIEAHEKQLIK